MQLSEAAADQTHTSEVGQVGGELTAEDRQRGRRERRLGMAGEGRDGQRLCASVRGDGGALTAVQVPGPTVVSAAATAVMVFSSRDEMNTSAPLRTKPSAIISPMPRPPPYRRGATTASAQSSEKQLSEELWELRRVALTVTRTFLPLTEKRSAMSREDSAVDLGAAMGPG